MLKLIYHHFELQCLHMFPIIQNNQNRNYSNIGGERDQVMINVIKFSIIEIKITFQVSLERVVQLDLNSSNKICSLQYLCELKWI